MESSRLSMADTAERLASSYGAFADAEEADAAAKEAADEDTSPITRMIYQARARITSDEAKSRAALKSRFGLSK